MKKEVVDFLIIGSGVAGLRAAIELAEHGKVLIVTKERPAESSTEYAQGGIAVALSDEDEVGIHFEDTLKAGDGLCVKEAVKILVEDGPERILELISWGADFDKEGMKLAFTMEAAHSRKRILHAQGDSTGRELERVLLNKVRSYPSVKKYPFGFAVDLIVKNGACLGAYILKGREMSALFAKVTVLATGGAGQIFSRTTNPEVTTGDGLSIAYRAGAVVEDMEFVQFHPTVLFAPSAPQFLLSEAMRGEGAILRNIHKEPFMSTYHPDGDLAPRDIVSRAIISQMVRTDSKHVFLDLTHLDSSFVKNRFPRIYATCLLYDVNIAEDLIPVSPAAHYIMGGVKTDLLGATNIRGLYAAGEVACTGVHGANRLASNSLLEGLVFGARAGKAALKYAKRKKRIQVDRKAIDSALEATSIPDCEEVRHLLRKLMWEKVGIIRCEKSLTEAKSQLDDWVSILDKVVMTRREIELKNMIICARLITKAALLRKESVGAHYRSDFPDRGEKWQEHIVLKKAERGALHEFTA
jgi:L-aspartate oxidase